MPDQEARNGYETLDANSRVLAKLGLSLVVLVMVVLVVMWLFYRAVLDRETRGDVAPSPLADTRETLAGPRLFLTPSEELDALKAAEDEILTSYGWVDAEGGWVRIPIERAMDVLLERGLPTRPDAAVPEEAGSP